ncbi:YciI family protein [Catenulispora yoronensis]|uniref:YciI family protein n=1 Tax=Catenulispora yoronensis TaxID=450799 RepID=A0ABN2TTS0_9ACTN
MSKYLVLIYENEADYGTLSSEESDTVTEAHRTFLADNKDAIIGGEALQRASTATSIRKGVVTDGAFVETKEAIGGYYLIEAPDLDAALAIGKQVPARFGGVEVRPVLLWDV